MVCGSHFNICIPQGSTFGPVVFRLRNTIVLSANAPAGAVEISVSPLSQNVGLGSTFLFGAVSVVTTASAATGDRTISVEPLSSALTKGLVAKGDPIDLTGKQVRSQIRQQFSDVEPLASFTCTVLSPTTNGELSISLPSTTSAMLPANIFPDKADGITDLQNLSFPNATDLKLFLPGLAPFYYDVEIFNVASPPVVDRYIYGRVIVTAEVTR